MPNPVLRTFDKSTQTGQMRPAPAAPSADELQGWYNQPSYGGTSTQQPNQQPGFPPPPPGAPGGWGGGGGGGGQPSRYMTLDDVIVRSASMLFVILITGAIAWLAAPNVATGLLIVGAMGGIGLGLFISFTQRANAATCLIYSAFEGLLLGAVSRAFNDWKPGIVIQALIGTAMVAGGVLIVYKIGAVRVTPKFTRIATAAVIGVFGLMIVNLIASLFVSGGLGLRDGGGLAIVFSLVCIGVAAMMLVMDFDMIEKGIKNGADEKFAWYASFGLMVTLIWMYLEILRLLGYLNND